MNMLDSNIKSLGIKLLNCEKMMFLATWKQKKEGHPMDVPLPNPISLLFVIIIGLVLELGMSKFQMTKDAAIWVTIREIYSTQKYH